MRVTSVFARECCSVRKKTRLSATYLGHQDEHQVVRAMRRNAPFSLALVVIVAITTLSPLDRGHHDPIPPPHCDLCCPSHPPALLLTDHGRFPTLPLVFSPNALTHIPLPVTVLTIV